MTKRLTEKYRLDGAGRQERKDFLGLTAEDEQRIAELKDKFAEIAPHLAEGFYRHLLAHPVTARFLQDPNLVARLKQEQMRYFHELVSGEYGEEYFEKRLRVGEAHQKVGLEPSWYLGAYNQYIQLCFPHFAEMSGGKSNPVLLSLMKVILLDIGLAVETYFAESTERLRVRNQELEEALHMYWQAELKAQQYAKLAGHEIRGSLNAIAAACESAAEDFGENLPAEARGMLDAARERCWQTAHVVEQILAEPENAGQRSWVDVHALLHELADRIEVYKELYESKGNISVELPTQRVQVWADRIGLREVFANLVSNAVRHLDKDPGRVNIEYLGDGQEHMFCVADNGPGMTPEVETHLFEPFFRGPQRGQHQGKGLGLHFVRAIVQQHGGRVWVESVQGSGSRFYFSLPKEPADSAARQIQAGRSRGSRLEPARGWSTAEFWMPWRRSCTGKRIIPEAVKSVASMRTVNEELVILYVEDDALTRQSIGHRLARQRMQVLEAESGERALEILQDRPPLSVALLDLELPGLDGIQTYEQVRRSYPDLPVVICSAHLTPARRRRLENMGIPPVCLLEKPCPFSALLAVIQMAVGSHERDAE